MKKELRDQAAALRAQGLSYSQIAATIKVSKGTLSAWLSTGCKPEAVVVRETAARARSADTVRRKWELLRKQVRDAYDPPLDDPGFTLGLGVYWGEGAKHSSSDVEVTNMDYRVILAFKRWVERYFVGEFERWDLELATHQEQEACRQHWAEKLDLNPQSIRCRSIKPRAETPYKGPARYGIGQLRVCGKGVWKIRQKIEKALSELV